MLEHITKSEKLKSWITKLNLTIDEVNDLVASTCSIMRCDSFVDLPSAGDINILYITIDSYTAYVWNPNTIQYEQINKINKIICGDSRNG